MFSPVYLSEAKFYRLLVLLVIACSLTTRSVEQPAIKADIVTVKTRWFIFIILPINGYKSLAALLS
jgi:hypothetical protein